MELDVSAGLVGDRHTEGRCDVKNKMIRDLLRGYNIESHDRGSERLIRCVCSTVKAQK